MPLDMSFDYGSWLVRGEIEIRKTGQDLDADTIKLQIATDIDLDHEFMIMTCLTKLF